MGRSMYYSCVCCCTETWLACRCGCGSGNAGKTAAWQMKRAKTAAGRLLFGMYFEAGSFLNILKSGAHLFQQPIAPVRSLLVI